MQGSTAVDPGAAAQDRPTAARSPRRLALGARLTIYVTLSVAAVITLITVAGTLIAQRQLDNDLRETAEVTAFAVADDIELRQEPVAADALVPVLQSFMNAAPDLRSITVFRAVNGRAETLVSTSVVAPAPATLVERVIARGETVTSQPTPDSLFVAVPIHAGDTVTGAVAVAVSLGAVRQLQRAAGLIAFGGAAVAMLALAVLINLLARRLLLAPLNEIHRVMGRARGGDLGARAHVTQDSEMKDVADGLNAMLAELDDLHRSLSQRVDAATGALRERNVELVRSYESVSRLRETAARAQQLAAIGTGPARRLVNLVDEFRRDLARQRPLQLPALVQQPAEVPEVAVADEDPLALVDHGAHRGELGGLAADARDLLGGDLGGVP